MRLAALAAALAISPSFVLACPATADVPIVGSTTVTVPGWTVKPGAALEGGDALYCNGPCDVHNVRNVQSPFMLDVAAGNSDPNAGPIVVGNLGFCWDISCYSRFFGGQKNLLVEIAPAAGPSNALVQVTPYGSYFRSPNGKLQLSITNHGVRFYTQPRVVR